MAYFTLHRNRGALTYTLTINDRHAYEYLADAGGEEVTGEAFYSTLLTTGGRLPTVEEAGGYADVAAKGYFDRYERNNRRA